MRKARSKRKPELKPLGRPKDSGSRQQTQPDQVIHTGSPKADRKLTDKTKNATAPATPPQKPT